MCLFFFLPQRAMGDSPEGEPRKDDAATPVACSKSESTVAFEPSLPAYTEQDRIRAHALGLRV